MNNLKMRRALFSGSLTPMKGQWPIPKCWPMFYLLEVNSGGYGLFAKGGRHGGAGMGHFWPDSGALILYGTFLRRGGMSYSDWKYKRRFTLKRPKV